MGVMVINEITYVYERVEEGVGQAICDIKMQVTEVDDRVDVAIEEITHVRNMYFSKLLCCPIAYTHWLPISFHCYDSYPFTIRTTDFTTNTDYYKPLHSLCLASLANSV